jgi:hypothetical protein
MYAIVIHNAPEASSKAGLIAGIVGGSALLLAMLFFATRKPKVPKVRALGSDEEEGEEDDEEEGDSLFRRRKRGPLLL